MCRYLRRGVYWFYNDEVGVGPSNININIVNAVDGSGNITTSTYTCTVDGVADVGCLGTAGGIAEAVVESRNPAVE